MGNGFSSPPRPIVDYFLRHRLLRLADSRCLLLRRSAAAVPPALATLALAYCEGHGNNYCYSATNALTVFHTLRARGKRVIYHRQWKYSVIFLMFHLDGLFVNLSSENYISCRTVTRINSQFSRRKPQPYGGFPHIAQPF